jgi:hypothetical protein
MENKYSQNWKMSAGNIYLFGIFGWIIILILIPMVGHFHYGFNFPSILFEKLNWIYPILFCFGFYPLIWNYVLWKNEQQYADYRTEVEVIEFVERNANYLILALTAVSILASIIVTAIVSVNKEIKLWELIPVEFFWFQGFSLLFALIGVFPLIWTPPIGEDAKLLVRLRHTKTICYTYAIFFLAAGIIGLFKTVL